MDPRVHHLTHSNIPASEAEILLILSLISLEETNILNLEDQIRSKRSGETQQPQAHSVVSTLVSQREEHRERIKVYESTLSVIRHVPTEILAKIFLLCCIEPASLPPRSNEPRLAVSHTCRRWRLIALDLQKMWNCVSSLFLGYDDSLCTSVEFLNTFDILDTAHKKKLPRHYDVRNDMVIGIFREWLGRVGSTLPLEIKFDYPFSIFASEMLIRDIIIPNSPRFGTVEMHFPQDTLQFFMELPSISFDLLEVLDLSIDMGSSRVPSLAGPTVLHSAPRLRSLGFDIPIGFDSTLIRFPLSTLTSLRLCCPSVPICLTVLAQCPRLVECKLDIWRYVAKSMNARWKSVSLPYLRTLNLLETENYFPIDSLFERLTLPALEDLSIPFWENSDSFVSLASRSAFTLTKLSVKPYSCSLRLDVGEALETMLRLTPSLFSLTLFGIPNARVLEMLGSYELVPRLQVIAICEGYVWFDRASVDGLTKIVEPRRPRKGTSKSCMRKVVLRVSIANGFLLFLPLEQWRQDGLEVDVQGSLGEIIIN